ncbi:MAG: hypothetical protein PHO37_17370 [Kiritimatiellae bacterium]|nr:hypothetical protein [Kiritimatiellia bacterium]
MRWMIAKYIRRYAVDDCEVYPPMPLCERHTATGHERCAQGCSSRSVSGILQQALMKVRPGV